MVINRRRYRNLQLLKKYALDYADIPMEEIDALVVFSNNTEIPLLKLCKKGYRHCQIFVRDRENWVCVDPMAHYMSVCVIGAMDDFDLRGHIIDQGHTYVPVRGISIQRRPAPLSFLTCVSICKRILGMRDRRIVTPSQLYTHLSAQARMTYRDYCVPVSQIGKCHNNHHYKGEKQWVA